MQQCDDLLESTADRHQELEASPLMSGLRDLMYRADALRALEEQAEAARAAFRAALEQLREAVEMHADAARLEAAMASMEVAARACIEERARLHQHSESVRGLITGLNQQLGGLLGRG